MRLTTSNDSQRYTIYAEGSPYATMEPVELPESYVRNAVAVHGPFGARSYYCYDLRTQRWQQRGKGAARKFARDYGIPVPGLSTPWEV